MRSKLVGTSVAYDFVPTLQVWPNWLRSLSAACLTEREETGRRRQGHPVVDRPEDIRLGQGAHTIACRGAVCLDALVRPSTRRSFELAPIRGTKGR
jgi:hypothetical protein